MMQSDERSENLQSSKKHPPDNIGLITKKVANITWIDSGDIGWSATGRGEKQTSCHSSGKIFGLSVCKNL